MSQLAAGNPASLIAKTHPAMREDNVHVRPGHASGLSAAMLIIGGVCLLATIAGALVLNGAHALAAFEVGAMTVTAISLGGMFWTMIFHQVNAGWAATVRRQFENLMAMLPWCIALMAIVLAIELLAGGLLLRWIGEDPHTNHLLELKAPYLNAPFLVARFLIYAVAWIYLSTRLWSYSREQDATGERFITNRARRTSAWGLLVFALTVTFFAFDFLMSMDYRFFSTMWGVYYFASCALGALAAVLLILGVLRSVGYLTTLVTSEHTHDLGKLLFGFTVFWAYIAYSQYFLIWYSNIPEETAWYLNRSTGGWENLAALLVIVHFVIPFLILLVRKVKRSALGAATLASWLLAAIVLDMVYVIRPMVYLGDAAGLNPGAAGWWLDLVAVAGVVALWGGLLVRQIARNPLVAVQDPRLPEAINHDNAV